MENRTQWEISSTKWSDDALAIEFLRGCGYKLTNRYNWLVPDGLGVRISDEHVDAAKYLVDEWDFGYFVYSLEDGEVAYG